MEVVETIDKRGRFNQCQQCNHKFKHGSISGKEKWQKNKYPCPKCGHLYSTKPPTESKLFILQDKFFDKNRCPKVMVDIIQTYTIYAKSLIKKGYSDYFSNTFELNTIADSAVSLVIENFYNKENYFIYGSWAGALSGKIRQSLFSPKEIPIPKLILEKRADIKETFSLQSLYDDGHGLQIENPNTEEMDRVDNEMDGRMVVNSIIQLTEKFLKKISPYEGYKLLSALVLSAKLNKLKKRNIDSHMNKYWDKWGKEGRDSYDSFNELIADHLRCY